MTVYQAAFGLPSRSDFFFFFFPVGYFECPRLGVAEVRLFTATN
jgi:hypothetical protein